MGQRQKEGSIAGPGPGTVNTAIKGNKRTYQLMQDCVQCLFEAHWESALLSFIGGCYEDFLKGTLRSHLHVDSLGQKYLPVRGEFVFWSRAAGAQGARGSRQFEPLTVTQRSPPSQHLTDRPHVI